MFKPLPGPVTLLCRKLFLLLGRTVCFMEFLFPPYLYSPILSFLSLPYLVSHAPLFSLFFYRLSSCVRSQLFMHYVVHLRFSVQSTSRKGGYKDSFHQPLFHRLKNRECRMMFFPMILLTYTNELISVFPRMVESIDIISFHSSFLQVCSIKVEFVLIQLIP
jgi:hypothetical protein